jgi:hypothetical protein
VAKLGMPKVGSDINVEVYPCLYSLPLGSSQTHEVMGSIFYPFQMRVHGREAGRYSLHPKVATRLEGFRGCLFC